MVIARFDVYLVTLDPAVGHEIRKTRPCLVISPDDLNQHLRTVIIAPMTTRGHSYPYRADCRFQGKRGAIALDQMRTVDRARLVKRLGKISIQSQQAVFQILAFMFAP